MGFGHAGIAAGGSKFSGGMGRREFARPRATPKWAGEKRFAPRREHKLAAYVTSNGDKASQPCYVRDSSSTGLLIEMRGLAATAGRLPDRVSVYIPLENVEFDCRVVWKSGSRAGLRFVTAARHYHKPAALGLFQRKNKPQSLIGRLFARR
ncbi:MAG: PilZ domain-containing protein [Pseudomonadota bacterium]